MKGEPDRNRARGQPGQGGGDRLLLDGSGRGGGGEDPVDPADQRLQAALADENVSSREQIVSHARASGLDWVVDPSNANSDFSRNFVRHKLIPGIAERFPGYRATLARAASHLQEVSGLLDALADMAGYLRAKAVTEPARRIVSEMQHVGKELSDSGVRKKVHP